VLDILLGLAHVKVEVREDPARMRPSDVTLLVGDCGKFRAATAWEPTIPFEVTLKDLLEHWRKRV
jgi:GDP-4-dehydro-6-deoxy-D-mannose reductase